MLRNTPLRYGSVTILFHWVIALLFIGQVSGGVLMRRFSDPKLQFELYQWHKSFGFLILGLAVLRLLWRLANRGPKDVETLAPWEKFASRAAQILLYAALIAIPLAGWAIASSTPLNIPSLMFNLVLIPHLPLEVSEEAEIFWSNVHSTLAYTAAAIASIHILAALRHHFWLHDGVLKRMLSSREPTP
jgi:cytochrome b561